MRCRKLGSSDLEASGIELSADTPEAIDAALGDAAVREPRPAPVRPPRDHAPLRRT